MIENIGAGEGNRTLVFSLEGCCSTIELHPRHRLPNTAGRRSQLPPGALSPAFRPLRTGCGSAPRPRPLNSGGLPAYIDVFRNQRKEVIQCLLPSAVTSLGSPAKLSIRAWHRGALSPGPASKKSGATGSPRRAFSLASPLSPASRVPLRAVHRPRAPLEFSETGQPSGTASGAAPRRDRGAPRERWCCRYSRR